MGGNSSRNPSRSLSYGLRYLDRCPAGFRDHAAQSCRLGPWPRQWGIHVETGSFHYSDAAVNKNAENVLMVSDNKSITVIYTQQWKLLWSESVDVKQNY